MTTLDKMLQGLANALGASLSTLTTTAKTVVGAINELKSGLTTANTNISTNTSKIGTGSLNTTAQTIISAINELNSKANAYYTYSGSRTTTYGNPIALASYPAKKAIYIGWLKLTSSSSSAKVHISGSGLIGYTDGSYLSTVELGSTAMPSNGIMFSVTANVAKYGMFFAITDGTATLNINQGATGSGNVPLTHEIKVYEIPVD